MFAVVHANGIHQGLRFSASHASKRISITVPCSTFRHLEERSAAEGRSLSNLAAYLLERGLQGSEDG